MPLRLWLLTTLLVLALVPVHTARADDDDVEFPYQAYINGDDVYVRSGPGQNYYPTQRLKRGDAVYIYRHDPGGWYAIRPPAESFSWIAAEFVEAGNGAQATVKGDRVVTRVGSTFSDVRDVIQVRLDHGEPIEVIEARRIGSGDAAQTWYKIAPPPGEFRWVSGKFIDREPPAREARRRDHGQDVSIPPRAHLVSETALHSEALQNENDEQLRDEEKSSAANDRPRSKWVSVQREGGEHGMIKRPASESDSGASAAPRSEDRVIVAAAEEKPVVSKRTRSTVERRPPEDRRMVEALEQIDLELSTMVAQPVDNWDLRPLRTRTDQLLSGGETALDRGRARLLQRKLARFEDIKERHNILVGKPSSITPQMAPQMVPQQPMLAAPVGPFSPLQMVATLPSASMQPSSMAMGSVMQGNMVPGSMPLGGTGRLMQIQPAQTTVASFALVDNEGRVSHYITPSPGVDLRQYIGRDVAVEGTAGFMPDARTQHVTAKRITVKGNQVLR